METGLVLPTAAGIMNNQTALQKADLSVSDLTAGGLLQPAQAQRFIRIFIKEAVIGRIATVTPMRAPKQLIEKSRFNSRILRAGSEATALGLGDRSKLDLSKVELDAQLFKAEVRLSNEVLEDSIERGDLRNTVMQQMGESIARDMDEISVQGDTTSGDSFLASFDGMLAQATSNTVDATLATANKTILRDMIKTMPSEFLRNRQQLRFLTSVDADIDYRDSLSDRGTMLGDAFTAENRMAGYSGIGMLPVPLFPENLGVGSNTTNIILTDPKNINIGVWRNIRLESDKLVSEGVLIIVATLRFDMKYTEELAVVKAINVKVS